MEKPETATDNKTEKPKNQPKKSPNRKNRKSKSPREQPLTGLITARAALKKVFHCFYKTTFPRKKKNSLFRLMISLSSREVLYTKLNVISSCFAIQMLSQKGHSMFVKIFQLSSDEEMGLSCKHISRPIRARAYYLSYL